jgi:rRNA processing protein Krr1/Pno1
MSDVLGLQWKLTEARNENLQENRTNWYSSGNGNYNNRSTNYRSRTASITREQQDEREKRKQMIQREVIQLLDEGYSVDQTVNILEDYASPSEVARIAEYNQRRRKFLMTGNLDLPGQMVGITIG